MPLPPPAPRQPLHHRRIDIRGYARDDGLWDIEAHLTDTKTYPFPNRWRGEIAPGEPLHDMWLRLTVDEDFVVRGVEAATDASPFAICPDITPRFKALEGVRIGRGWNAKVRATLGGVKGCTHLVELLGPIATVAFQTIWAARKQVPDGERPRHRPGYLDQCHALASDGEVVREHFPDWYRAPADDD